MSGTNSPQGGLTRRSFLKTTAAVAGAAALAGGTSLTALADDVSEPASEEQTFRVCCRGNCGSSCPAVAKVRDGKVVSVSAAEMPGDDAPRRRLCVKGYAQPQRLYDPDRAKYPMRRVEGTERGAGQWERISWDEAIDELSAKMGAAIAECGGTSVGIWSSYGSYGVLNGTMGGYMSAAYGRLITLLGGTVLGASADNAQIWVQGQLLGNAGNDFVDVVNAKTIVAWGGNPAEAYVHAWQFVCQAREKGAKLVTIDPQFTASALHSDIYVPIIPGTDGALMLAMVNYIVSNGLADVDFLKSLTVAPFLVKEDGTYLRMSDLGVAPAEGPLDAYGKPTVIDPVVVWDEATGAHAALDKAKSPSIDGEYEVGGFKVSPCYAICMGKIAEYTVERAAEITGIPAEQIEELALLYATSGPTWTMTFQGFGHHVNSHHNYKNLAFLHAVTGNVGKSGASVMGAPSNGMFPVNMTAYFLGAGPGANLCGMYLPQLMEQKQWAGVPVDLRVLWICNGNVLSCESGRLELIEAVKKVDYVVCVTDVLNDSSQWADLVLPVPHSYESTDFDPICSTPFPTFRQKAVEPAFECKSDIDIVRLVADKLGFGQLFAKSDDDFLREIIDTEYNVAAGAGYDAFSSGELVRNYVLTKESQIVRPGAAEAARFKFYLEHPQPRNNFGQAIADYEKHPYYEHANEAYMENPLREQYPLFGCSQHDKYHIHSQVAHTSVIRELDPEPMVKINASDAAARGIAQGDYVRVRNDRGYVVLKALVTEGIMPGVVSLPHGWQADQFVEGHAQDLTNIYMNDFCSNSAFYDFLCEVEKYEGGVK